MVGTRCKFAEPRGVERDVERPSANEVRVDAHTLAELLDEHGVDRQPFAHKASIASSSVASL